MKKNRLNIDELNVIADVMQTHRANLINAKEDSKTGAILAFSTDTKETAVSIVGSNERIIGMLCLAYEKDDSIKRVFDRFFLYLTLMRVKAGEKND